MMFRVVKRAALLSTLGYSAIVSATSVSSKILIIAKDAASAASASSGLQGYGIPYENLIVPQAGIALPALNSSTTAANYGGIVVVAEVSYDMGGGVYGSALTTAQWQQLYDYQTAFGVRMIRLDVFPGPNFGTTAVGDGCCNTGVEQLVSFTNTTAFSGAGIKANAAVSSQGLWHYPATISDPATTWEIAKFAPGGTFTSDTVAAVINQFANGAGTRQQMSWFIGFAPEWSQTSNFLQHAWIQWITRGAYTGFRRIYFNTQIDDVHLSTELYLPNGTEYRIVPGDLAAHVPWMADVNSRMPAGSDYFVELGHNGNGNIEAALAQENTVCNPSDAIEYEQEDSPGPLEFQKPIGTGTDLWPTTPTTFTWSLACSQRDALLAWLIQPANLNAYAHVSHTFTHEALNNATFSDVYKEITFNQAWLKSTGIDKATRFSANGLIPPAITGLHNGDAIRAFMTNGIRLVVGDNTRPVLMNSQNSFWPLISTVSGNGYAGLTIVPRWATTIYYNCDSPECTTQEWINTSAGSGDFTTLLNNARTENTRHLLGLHQDPFMFHQANMRQVDVPQTTVEGKTGKFSLLMTWVETIVAEMTRLTTWPIVTLKHDDIANAFIARMSRDACKPSLTWNYSTDGKSIVSVTVGSTSNYCTSVIPVTVPGPVTNANGATTEQRGADPLTIWAKLNGNAITYTLQTPIAL